MSLDLVGLLVGVAFGIGFLAAHILTKKDMEQKLSDAETELRRKIGETMQKLQRSQLEYKDLQTQVKFLGDTNGDAAEFNKLWQKIASKLPTP